MYEGQCGKVFIIQFTFLCVLKFFEVEVKVDFVVTASSPSLGWFHWLDGPSSPGLALPAGGGRGHCHSDGDDVNTYLLSVFVVLCVSSC